MRSWAAIAVILAGGVAVAAPVPMPRPRPAALGPSAGSKTAPATPEANVETDQPAEGKSSGAGSGEAAKAAAAAGPPPPSACQVALKAIAVFAPHAPVKGPGQCGIDDPVTLEAAILPDKTRVDFNPPALLRCDMATTVARWVREEVAPVATHLGSPLRGIENYDSYDCRGRNRVPGAKMSEHGRGNALDVRGLKLASGAVAHLTDVHVSKQVREDLRKSACNRFMTVLGPGSDGYHEEHVHVDLAERKHAYAICEWDVRQPLDNEAPSPHILSSRAPTPHETMPALIPPNAEISAAQRPSHTAKRH